MRVLVQRVKRAKVSARQGQAEIGKGLLLFVGIGKDDSLEDILQMADKIKNLRIFEDHAGKMNLDIGQTRGEVLNIPQFTLYADTKRGNRPGFDMSAAPDKAKDLWSGFNQQLRKMSIDVKEGFFGAHMEVNLVNDGPVTIWLDSKQR